MFLCFNVWQLSWADGGAVRLFRCNVKSSSSQRVLMCLNCVDWCLPLIQWRKQKSGAFSGYPSVLFKCINTLSFSSVISYVTTACFLLKALLLYRPLLFFFFLTFREGSLQGVKCEAVFCKEYIKRTNNLKKSGFFFFCVLTCFFPSLVL